ncbi:MAG: Trk system potassium transporter TrkA [Candidatus Symbiodolus clandestinus]
MKVIILGGGRVGSALAEQLVKESHDVTVIEKDPVRLKTLQETLDLRCIDGYATYPQSLKQAGADAADCIVAVTDSDEINLLACQIVYSLFNTPQRIARVSAPNYYDYQSVLFQQAGGLAVHQVFSPVQWVAESICQLVAHPGVRQYWTFAQHKLTVVAIKVAATHPWLQRSVIEVLQQPGLAKLSGKIILLRRQAQLSLITADQIIEVDDELWCLVASEQLSDWLAAWRGLSTSLPQRIIIVGGGLIGAEVARRLSTQHRVKIIERNHIRASLLAATLPNSVIFCSHAADHALLLEEHIEQTDQFIAVTNDDEDNILSALLAHHLGAKQTLVLIQRPIYRDLIQNQGIDQVVMPQLTILSRLLTQLRSPAVQEVYLLPTGEGELIEWQLPSLTDSALSEGYSLAEVNWPASIQPLAWVRGELCWFQDYPTELQAEDRLILLSWDQQAWQIFAQQLQRLVEKQRSSAVNS